MKQQTQNYYLIALRMFLKYLIAEGFETLPPQQIKLAKTVRKSCQTLSVIELQRLCNAPDLKTTIGKRDYAIIELLISTGLRTSELCALSVTGIDLTQGDFLIERAQGNQRFVFLSNTARQAINAYLQARTDQHPALFIRHGRKVNETSDLRIHPRAVQRMLKAYAAVCGITIQVTPQILRHTFANDLLQNGADIRSAQTLLGHATPTQTRWYHARQNFQLPKPPKN